jgi:hypothetical protein
MFFVQDYRERIKEENPDASFGEVGKLLGAKWKEMSDAEKKVRISSVVGGQSLTFSPTRRKLLPTKSEHPTPRLLTMPERRLPPPRRPRPPLSCKSLFYSVGYG